MLDQVIFLKAQDLDNLLIWLTFFLLKDDMALDTPVGLSINRIFETVAHVNVVSQVRLGRFQLFTYLLLLVRENLQVNLRIPN